MCHKWFVASCYTVYCRGDSPLHCACSADQPAAVQSLLERAAANPTMRNEQSQWVPLHVAAWRGSMDCILALLQCHAPLRPRTAKNESPADLARLAGHHEAAALLERYPAAYCEQQLVDWYHPDTDRRGALQLLQEAGSKDGAFLVRNSSKKKSFYVLSMIWKGRGHHFEIEKRGLYVFIDEGPYCDSLEQLVQHYTRFSDGLPCQLRCPVRTGEVAASLKLDVWASSSLASSNTAAPPRPAPAPARFPPAVPPRAPGSPAPPAPPPDIRQRQLYEVCNPRVVSATSFACLNCLTL